MRFLLCDDHALFRDGLEMVIGQLDDEIELVGVGNGASALAAVDADPDFDLVLLDLGLPDADGLDILSKLRVNHPDVPVVVLSASESGSDVRTALDRGASGFIPKSTEGGVLLAAIQLVLSGGVYVPPLVVSESGPRPARNETVQLSPRQGAVLRLLARGLTNQEIAGALEIAPGTVKSHIVRLYELLDVNNRTEAAMRMHEMGLGED